jgi:hypothetical protein
MWEPRRLTTYGPPWPVTGIALPFLSEERGHVGDLTVFRRIMLKLVLERNTKMRTDSFEFSVIYISKYLPNYACIFQIVSSFDVLRLKLRI